MASTTDYSEFASQVMEYAVDSAPDLALNLGGRPIARLDERTFVESLYVPWPDDGFEELLYHRLVASTQLTCIAAFRGCGKTSALRHAVHRIRREHAGTIEALIVDVKKLFDAGAFAPLTDDPTPEVVGSSHSIFKTELRKLAQTLLIPGPENAVRLAAWAMAGASDDTDSFNDLLVAPFIDLSNEILLAAGVRSVTRRARVAVIESFLGRIDEFTRLQALLIPHLSMAHVVRAAMAINGWHRIVLIFDNVDRIPTPYQVKFLEVVNDTHNALSGACGTVVAMRREALFASIPRPNEKGDPIDIVAPDEAHFPVVMFPDARADHVRHIFQQRHRYSIGLYEANYAGADIHSLNALHGRLVDEFVRDSIQALANGSVRALARIYTGFLRYIERIEKAGYAREHNVRNDSGQLQTLFFLFLRQNADEFGFNLYEEVRPEPTVDRVHALHDVAFPHHVLLTSLFNLQLETPERDVTLQTLIKRVTNLGHSVEAAKSALREMHAKPNDPPSVIELSGAAFDDAVEDLARPTRIRLTAMGQVLSTSLLHKVGYTWARAYEVYQRLANGTAVTKSYLEFTSLERARVFFDYVRLLALNHVAYLAFLGASEYGHRDRQWLNTYRRHFGIDRLLHPERLCTSAASFYAPQFTAASNPFSLFRRDYSSVLDCVLKGRPAHEASMERMQRGFDEYLDSARRTGGQ